MSERNVNSGISDSNKLPLDLMQSSLPYCPICKTKADYSISDNKKSKVICNNCGAEWQMFFTLSKDQLVSLRLEKPDREKHSKDLKGVLKILGFWQFCNVSNYSSSIDKTIRKSLENNGAINFKKIRENAHNELLDQGDFSLFSALSLLGGAYPGLYNPNFIRTSLALVKEFSDIRVLPDLQRIFKSTVIDEHRLSIFELIVEIVWQNEFIPELSTFLKMVAQTDKNASIRSAAVASLIIQNGKTANEDLVPFIVEVITKEKDIDARATNLLNLQKISSDERVIDCIIASLSVKEIPNYKFELPTSWLDAAKEVIYLFTAPSLGEIAANLLIEIGNRKGIESLLEAIVNSQLDSFFLQRKRIRYMFKSYPYSKDYVINIFETSKDEKHTQNAERLLKIVEEL
ncbi:MAG: hypothetical protein GXY10_08035 [Clostridiales bacterium]|nr:hypothetical protein [Clostridiales bacterium]